MRGGRGGGADAREGVCCRFGGWVGEGRGGIAVGLFEEAVDASQENSRATAIARGAVKAEGGGCAQKGVVRVPKVSVRQEITTFTVRLVGVRRRTSLLWLPRAPCGENTLSPRLYRCLGPTVTSTPQLPPSPLPNLPPQPPTAQAVPSPNLPKMSTNSSFLSSPINGTCPPTFFLSTLTDSLSGSSNSSCFRCSPGHYESSFPMPPSTTDQGTVEGNYCFPHMICGPDETLEGGGLIPCR